MKYVSPQWKYSAVGRSCSGPLALPYDWGAAKGSQYLVSFVGPSHQNDKGSHEFPGFWPLGSF